MNTSNLNARCCSIRSPIRKWLIGRKLRKLKLDDSQIAKLDSLFASASSASKNHDNAKYGVQKSISVMLAEEGFNRKKAVELIHTAAEQHVEHATEIVEAFGEFYQGLEPWQQKQVQAMWQKRRHCTSRRCH